VERREFLGIFPFSYGKIKPPSNTFILLPNLLNRPKRGGMNRLEKVGPEGTH
jgi:hypothetical protein